MNSQQRKTRPNLPRKLTFKPARKQDTHPREVGSFHPHIHGEAELLLSNIGVPEQTPFVPDPFQKKALENILVKDVLVSAPTGSGKTWIAVEAARNCLSKGLKVWYATPLKALSNSKNEEFGATFGTENVGILTGDRKENSDAPLIVGTTEILRNQLYDSMESGLDIDVDLVILDEAHYLGDPDRGVVWEEVLIYLPPRVRILLLSATISNATEVANWLENIRNSPCKVVLTVERPVPLNALFLAPSGELTPFLRGKRLFPQVALLAKSQKKQKRSPSNEPPDFNRILDVLRHFNLLPAIIFMKSRSDCDKALGSLRPAPLKPHEDGFDRELDAYLEANPDLRTQRHIDRLLTCRVGAHHAGHLPAWRLLVENMMQAGRLEAIFSTSTVAAGVNFPARTVVILQTDRFDGRSFVDMTATDFHQMTGRAGRRGKDKAGFTVMVPGKFFDISVAQELLTSSPEPLRSQIAINFSMVLNLLLSHDPAGVIKLLELSFASYSLNQARAKKVKTKLIEQFYIHTGLLEELGYLDKDGVPTSDGKWAAKLRLDQPLLIAELIRSGDLSNLDPTSLASLIAPFVVDKDREIQMSRELWNDTRKLWKQFRNIIQRLKPLVNYMIDKGFDFPPISFWPCAATFLWAGQVEWDALIENLSADQGDLAMMLLRTADHLRQIVGLEDEQPALANAARQGISLIMRPPII
ncbi:MAG: DEAD/DEAH box helicase [Syntrophaceae bacterium]|nr:DEAD/DEAH box helicase [Syntrophaceae bacterium]